MNTVRIDPARCKACGLCIPACPRAVLAWSETRNPRGQAVPAPAPDALPRCTACGNCYLVCPDQAVRVESAEDPA